MRWSWVVLVLACACTRSPSAPQGPGPAPAADDACANIKVLAQVMDCELAPYRTGRSTDEAAFRLALTQLRDLAPSDPAFHGSPSWPEIVDRMLETRDYAQGCNACHRTYLPIYRRGFSATEIPWTSVHPTAAH